MPTPPPALQAFDACQDDPAVQALIAFITNTLGESLDHVASWSVQAGQMPRQQFWLRFTDGVRAIEGFLQSEASGACHVYSFRTGFMLASEVEAIKFEVAVKEE